MARQEFEVSNQFIQYAARIGHTILFRTHLFGKDYVWMKDTAGTIYLEPLW